ncbi:MAG: type II toxin-antitoxin system HigB family toxin [Anaerolineae bacterium]|jgi:mRNA interferase HigB
MHVIKKKTLIEFWQLHPDAEGPLRAWYRDATQAYWVRPTDLTESYQNVRIIPNSRAIFDIGGNKYRLVVHIFYPYGRVYIRFIGTHAEYDRIDATTI